MKNEYCLKPLESPIEPIPKWHSMEEVSVKLNEVIAKLNYVCGYIVGLEERLRDSVVNGSVVMRLAEDDEGKEPNENH